MQPHLPWPFEPTPLANCSPIVLCFYLAARWTLHPEGYMYFTYTPLLELSLYNPSINLQYIWAVILTYLSGILFPPVIIYFTANFRATFFFFFIFSTPHLFGSPREAGFGLTFWDSTEEVQNRRTHPAQYLFHLMFTEIFTGHSILLNMRLYARALYLKTKSAQNKSLGYTVFIDFFSRH